MNATAYTLKPAAGGLWLVIGPAGAVAEPESLRLAKSRMRNLNHTPAPK